MDDEENKLLFPLYEDLYYAVEDLWHSHCDCNQPKEFRYELCAYHSAMNKVSAALEVIRRYQE